MPMFGLSHRLSKTLPLIVACMLASIAVPIQTARSAEAIIRVAPSGADVSACGSATQPCATIQFAVNKAASGDEIRVAAGTYTTNAASGPGNPALPGVVEIVNKGTLTVRGGYSTANWETSNPAANVSLLDGQNARRAMYIRAGPTDALKAQCQVTVSGFQIQNGLATSIDTFARAYGGGLYANDCAVVALSDLIIRDSMAVGGNEGDADPLTTVGVGGGMALLNSTFNLNGIRLENNSANGGSGTSSSPRGGFSVGGGAFLFNSTLTIDRLVAVGNRTEGGDAPGSAGEIDGQRADGLGGGLSFIDVPSFTLTNSVIEDNTAIGGDAGRVGALGLGGGIYLERSTGSVAQTVVQKNNALGGESSASGSKAGSGLGGGFFSTGTSLSMNAVQVLQNTATGGNTTAVQAAGGDGSGGGVYLTGQGQFRSIFNADNTIIAANEISTGSGNGSSDQSGSFGGGVSAQDTRIQIRHATIAANRAGGENIRRGAAIALLGTGPNVGTNGTIINTIIADHNESQFSPVYVNAAAGAVTLNGTLWSNNQVPNIEDGFGRPVVDQSPLTGDPRFVSPDTPALNYHISQNSDAVDKVAVSPLATDIDGQKRPFGVASDIGADEYSTEDKAAYQTYVPLMIK